MVLVNRFGCFLLWFSFFFVLQINVRRGYPNRNEEGNQVTIGNSPVPNSFFVVIIFIFSSVNNGD